jgi:capsid assembly protease
LLVHPDKMQVVLMALQERIGVAWEADALSPETSRFRGRRSESFPYRVENGTAILPIIGSLVNRGAWVGASSGLTSYEGVEAQLDAALTDSQVSRIVLDIDSPGGEAGGMFRLAEKIRMARQRKPITAFVNDMAASAAYGLAASTSRIIVSPSSMLGSIGVVLVHLDRSRELEKKGQMPTLIHAGAHKVDGHPFAPLPESVRVDLQAEVEKIYALFVASVAAGRLSLTDAAIRATEARRFLGEDAVAIGLADAIGGLDEALADSTMPFFPAKRGAKTEKAEMTDTTSEDSRIAAIEDKVREAHSLGRSEGEKAGAEVERARIQGILGSETAKGRESLAEHLAYATTMSVAEATAMLEKAPQTKAGTDYTARKEAAGTLGLGLPEPPRRAASPLSAAAIYAARRIPIKAA